jgi:DNA-binding CsgD family transcriptional regulator
LITPDGLVLGRPPLLLDTAAAVLSDWQLLSSPTLHPGEAWSDLAKQVFELSPIVKADLLARLRRGREQQAAAAFNTLWSAPPRLLIVGAIEPSTAFWNQLAHWHWQILFGATVLLVLPESAGSKPELRVLEKESYVTVVPWDIYSESWLREWTGTRFPSTHAISLSPQEAACMRLLAEGKSLPGAATALGVKIDTVKKYDSRVRAKVDYQGSSAGLIAKLVRSRII